MTLTAELAGCSHKGGRSAYPWRMSLEVMAASAAEIFDDPQFAPLCDEYRAEAGRNGDLYSKLPARAMYERLEAAGLGFALAARVGGELVGFAFVLAAPVLHSGAELIASVETIFISKAQRLGRAGVRLIDAAQRLAQERHGCSGLYVSAPTGGRLIELLPKLGFEQTNAVFLRKAKDDDKEPTAVAG